MKATIQQTGVSLKLGASVVHFEWPEGSDTVRVIGNPGGSTDERCSVQEAADRFDVLWDAGWR